MDFFFEGGFSAFALSFVSETQLRVCRGWNGMTTAYLGNHRGDVGLGGEESRVFRFKKDENSLVIFISAVCVCVCGGEGGGRNGKIYFKKESSGSTMNWSC